MAKKKKTSASNAAGPAAKRVILIRHGESFGQTARASGLDRKTSPKLLDAGLTRRGENQAMNLPKTFDVSQIELIVSSPLTRAASTASLIFRSLAAQEDVQQQQVPFIIRPEIREAGSKIPENQARSARDVIDSLQRLPAPVPGIDTWIDWTHLPDTWPNNADERRVSRVEKDAQWGSFNEFLRSRPEQTIAVVCHFMVINSMLRGQISQNVENCVPFECELREEGLIIIG